MSVDGRVRQDGTEGQMARKIILLPKQKCNVCDKRQQVVVAFQWKGAETFTICDDCLDEAGRKIGDAYEEENSK